MSNREFKERYQAARVLFARHQPVEALQAIQALLWERPDNKDLLLSKAMCLEALGRMEEAAEVCEAAIAAGGGEEIRKLQQRVTKGLPATEALVQKPVPPIDPAKILERLAAETPKDDPLSFMNSRRAYMVVFMMLFLIAAVVGPILLLTIRGVFFQR